MARGINKVILIGNLGADPEVRYPNNNPQPITNLRVATSENWKDKNTGDMQERTEWHRIVCFGRLAEIARDYARKGSKLYIEGSIRTNKWQDQSGQDRYTTEIHANTIELLDSKQGSGTASFDHSSVNTNMAPTMAAQPQSEANFATMEDDIPF